MFTDTYMDLIRAIDANGGVACQEVPDAFFIELGDGNCGYKTRVAKNLCEECPVKFECLQYALESNEQEGIWGGLTPAERRRLRRRSVA